MIVSISEAARLSGRSRQTLYDMKQSGKLSFTTAPDSGRPGIDMSELCRVFPRLKPDTIGQSAVRQSGHHQTDKSDSDALRAQVAILERLVEAKDALISQQNEMLKLLTFKRDETPAPEALFVSNEKSPIKKKPRTLIERLAAGIQTVLE